MIPFLFLPYLFQERFVEITKIEMVCNFLVASSATMKFCKKRKIVQNLEYSPSITVPKKSEALMQINNVEKFQKFKTLEIIDEFKIWFSDADDEEEDDDSEKPFQFDDFKMIPRSYKSLDLCNVFVENISDITNLVSPNLVEFTFLPKYLSLIFSLKWEKELNDLFAVLDKIENVRVMIAFDRDETPEEFKKIDGIIEKWRRQRKNSFKSRNGYWHIALRHGFDWNLAKIYRKINFKTSLGSGRTCYDCNIPREEDSFERVTQGVFIDKFL